MNSTDQIAAAVDYTEEEALALARESHTILGGTPDMTSDTIITEAMIAEAARRGACADALEWLREEPRTLGEVFDLHPAWRGWPAWALEHVPDLLPTDLLAMCARSCPFTALLYASAYLPADLLTELSGVKCDDT